MPRTKELGSARMGDAIGKNVNPNNVQCRTTAAQAYKSGVSTGGGRIDWPINNAAEPCPEFFEKAAGATDGRGRTAPR